MSKEENILNGEVDWVYAEELGCAQQLFLVARRGTTSCFSRRTRSRVSHLSNRRLDSNSSSRGRRKVSESWGFEPG